MKAAAFVLGLAALSSSAASAADLKLTPEPGPGQEIKYLGGRPATVSHQKMGSAGVLLAQEVFGSKDLVRLVLVARNLGPAATNLTPADVGASTDQGPVSVMSMADMEAMERARIKGEIQAAKLRAFGAALQGAGAAMQQNSPGYYSGSATTFGNTTHLTGTYQPPPDTTAQQFIAQQNMRAAQGDIAAARASIPEATASAAAAGFRPATIEPGQDAISALPISRLPKKTSRLVVTVNLNGERHEFAFNVAPYKR